MIYATKSGLRTIVGAADTAPELESFIAASQAMQPALYVECSLPSRSDMMLEDDFRGYRVSPRIYDHDSADQQAAFVAHFGLMVVPHDYATDKHDTMLRQTEKDPFWDAEADPRTIKEILGLTEHDPWDKRTDEQKALAAMFEEKAKAAKKAGKLSGESFGKKGELNVTDISTTKNADGSISVSGIEAVKGFDPSRIADDARAAAAAMMAEAKARAEREYFTVGLTGANLVGVTKGWAAALGLWDGDASPLRPNGLPLFHSFAEDDAQTSFIVEDEVAANKMLGVFEFLGIAFTVLVGEHSGEGGDIPNTRPFVREDGMGAYVTGTGGANVYYRVDFAGASMLEVHSTLLANDVLPHIVLVGAGQTRDVAWVAARSKAKAEELAVIVETQYGASWTVPPGADKVEVYGVNTQGQRLVPKGTMIVEAAPKVEPIRPWGKRAAEYAALPEDEQKALMAKLQCDEFLFCTSYQSASRGCVVWIVPAAHFAETGEMWPESIPEVVKGLPADFKELDPCRFNTKSRNDISVNFLLTDKGMRENLAFQMFINLLD